MAFIDKEGGLRSFNLYSLEDFKQHIGRYRNCIVVEKEELEDFELENITKVYGDFSDGFLIIIDYPGIGYINYFLIEQKEKYFLCLFKDKVDIELTEDFIDKTAYLAEYKI